MKSNNKLKGKDLINIGIYAAIYCLLMTCIAMLGYIPIMLPMLAVIGPIVFGVVFGFLADLVAKSGKYVSSKKTILSYGTFCVLLFGNFLPLYIDREAYFSTRQSFGAEYINTLGSIMQPWTAPAIIIAAFVCGMLGALLGKTLLKKHFVKAGIA